MKSLLKGRFLGRSRTANKSYFRFHVFKPRKTEGSGPATVKGGSSAGGSQRRQMLKTGRRRRETEAGERRRVAGRETVSSDDPDTTNF